LKYKDQEEQRTQLRQKIDLQSKAVDEISHHVDEERKVNKIEEEKYRKLSHINAALKAKLEFI
jgi:hypothetical protein